MSDETLNISTSAFFLNHTNNREGIILTMNKANKFGSIWVQHDDYWTFNESDVACRSAGFYASTFAFKKYNNLHYPYAYNWQSAMTHLRCNGTEQYLSDCEHDIVTANSNSYYRPFLASALCATNESDFNAPKIHLFDLNRQFNYQGLGWILMKTQGRNWSIICDEHFSMAEADVACRQLGYLGATDLLKGYRSNVYEDFPNAPIVKVKCNSNESNFQECEWEEIGDMCKSNTAAGIQCSSMRNILLQSIS